MRASGEPVGRVNDSPNILDKEFQMSLAIRFIAVVLVATSLGCQQTDQGATTTDTPAAQTSTTTPSTPAPETAPAAGEVKMPNGLVYAELKVGDGALAESGKRVSVHYTGWLTDGTKFDSSVDRNEPFTFELGSGAVIRGWDEGVKGMRVGGKRKLTIPSDLAYGPEGRGTIPANATLIFDVELLDVK